MITLRIGTTEGERVTILNNIEEVRRFTDNFNPNMTLVKCIGDLSLLGAHAQASLLKFIEEYKGTISCYASIDNVSPVLMSRFDKIVKVDNMVIGIDDFSVFVQQKQTGDANDSNVARDYVSKAGNNLEKFMVFKKLNRSIIQRVGVYL